MTTFCYSPDLHDNGPKTLLGQTKNFTGEEVLDLLADKPETAKLIAKKLWSFFAYPDPEPAIVERLARVYFDEGKQIKPMLTAIAKSPEFWSDKCVRQQVKSPVDFSGAIARQAPGRCRLPTHPPRPRTDAYEAPGEDPSGRRRDRGGP